MPRVKRGRGEKRRAGGGTWRRSGSVKDIVGSGVQGVVLGTRKTFVFYLGDSPKTAVRTKWIMYEYALIDQKMAEASYILCRVFAKSHHRCSTFKPSYENVVKSVRHIGVQCDDTHISLVSETGMIKGSSIDCFENNGLRKLDTLSGQLSDMPVAMQVDALAFEGDFIELNDLLSPLEGVN